MSAAYVLRSQDPDGTFLSQPWETAFLPRISENVMLPDGSEQWQEMVVSDIYHGPHRVDVWLGGSAGWEPGSVSALFENARNHRRASLRALF